MSHVGQQVSPDVVTDLSEPAVVEFPWVGTRASDNELWLKLFRLRVKSVEINQAGFRINVVLL